MLKSLFFLVPCYLYQENNQEKILFITLDNLFSVLSFLKQHIFSQFNLLTCISGIDFLGIKNRFCVVYELLSLTFNCRLRVKIFIDTYGFLYSCCSIFLCANWWEREIWDMFGIFFKYHPDLRRILTDYGFDGFPLRKDFPVCGYIDLRYDPKKRLICSEPLELSQNFRMFVFESQW